MPKQTVEDIDVKGKRVLLRVDFNVPLNINTGAVSDDSRIRASLPTIKYLVDHKARIIICSHLGRPEGKVVESLRMTPAAQSLSRLMGLPVSTASDCIGAEVEGKVHAFRSHQLFIETRIIGSTYVLYQRYSQNSATCAPQDSFPRRFLGAPLMSLHQVSQTKSVVI